MKQHYNLMFSFDACDKSRTRNIPLQDERKIGDVADLTTFGRGRSRLPRVFPVTSPRYAKFRLLCRVVLVFTFY